MILGLITGLFILPTLLEWLDIRYTFADILELVFGEPNPISRTIVLMLFVVFIFFIIRNSYRQYKKLS